jgi:hypothetical protein
MAFDRARLVLRRQTLAASGTLTVYDMILTSPGLVMSLKKFIIN